MTDPPPSLSQRLYPSIFLLFHSADGAPLIGGIWNPSVEGSKAFRIGLGYPITPLEGEDGKVKVALDKRAVLREIERLGKGLVLKVEEVQR
jgi:U3 small nucleolar RNA-associated protein 22